MARARVPAVATTLLLLLAVAIAAAAGASVCDTARCGKGRCIETPSPGPLPIFETFTCTCDPGWSQPETWLAPVRLPNMPCIVPNCSFSKTCLYFIVPVPNTPFDQCYAVNCGIGGDCEKGVGVSYACRCKPGFHNMLNDTSMPCIGSSRCFGADCAKLGLLNTPAAPAPAPSPIVGNYLY